MSNKFLENLEWRYSTKVFDKNKKIPENDLQALLDALVLSPSSFGLQPWKFILVENEKIREELKPHSWNQGQITDASHLLIFARVDGKYEDLINKYLDKVSEKRGLTREQLQGLEDMMKGYAVGKGEEGMKKWADEQVFIALGNALTVLSEMKIDSCAIGGFDPEKYDEILGLKEKGLASVVVLPIGYRNEEEDKYAKFPKIRFNKEDLVIKY